MDSSYNCPYICHTKSEHAMIPSTKELSEDSEQEGNKKCNKNTTSKDETRLIVVKDETLVTNKKKRRKSEKCKRKITKHFNDEVEILTVSTSPFVFVPCSIL